MVMENRRGVEEERLHKLLSPAERMPPLVPTAGTRTKLLFRLGGRKVLALKDEISCSLVSCKQATEGAAVEIASRTILHLSWLPKPRVFQDKRRNFRLLEFIKNKVTAPNKPEIGRTTEQHDAKEEQSTTDTTLPKGGTPGYMEWNEIILEERSPHQEHHCSSRQCRQHPRVCGSRRHRG